MPAGAALYAPPVPVRGPPSAGRSVLSVVWILSITSVLFLVTLNVAALLVSPAFVVPGIQGMSRGQIANEGLDTGSANWTFLNVGSPGATGSYVSTGGNPGGFLQLSLPAGMNVGGTWEQAFPVSGSAPFRARFQADVSVQSQGSSPQGGRIVIAIENESLGLNVAKAAAVLSLDGTPGWTTSPTLDVSGEVWGPRTYYLKVAYLAANASAPVTVGFDNIDLTWATNAYFYVIAPLPLPVLLFFSRDATILTASYAFVLACILVPVIYYSVRERRSLARAFTAPLESIGFRLRSMATWVAVAQTWLAVTFFQFAIIFLLEFLRQPPTSPISITPLNTWFLLYDLARASVVEELAFRVLPIGVPMAVGALLLRVLGQNRAAPSADPRLSNKHIMGAFRYLWGGQLRRDSPREALLAGWILLFASSAIFGYAHDVGWGWWKVVPAAVAGLAFGYLFLRHGIGAAILAHFLNDYLSALVLEGVGGEALSLTLDLLVLALVVAGAGFFIWYLIYASQHVRELWGRFGAHVIRQPVPMGAGPQPPVVPPGWVNPPPAPPATYAPPPYPSSQSFPAPPAFVRSPGQLPREYAPTYHPPPYGYPPVRFQCPACGWVEARYENRHFTCLRCGRTA